MSHISEIAHESPENPGQKAWLWRAYNRDGLRLAWPQALVPGAPTPSSTFHDARCEMVLPTMSLAFTDAFEPEIVPEKPE
jgi:hypothetical protein